MKTKTTAENIQKVKNLIVSKGEWPTYAAIGKILGCSKQAVHNALLRQGLKLIKKENMTLEEIADYLKWTRSTKKLVSYLKYHGWKYKEEIHDNVFSKQFQGIDTAKFTIRELMEKTNYKADTKKNRDSFYSKLKHRNIPFKHSPTRIRNN